LVEQAVFFSATRPIKIRVRVRVRGLGLLGLGLGLGLADEDGDKGWKERNSRVIQIAARENEQEETAE
jgi:hypothetical protein